MQEIGYPSDRRARMPNRIQGKPRDYQEPGSPMETGTKRAELISLTQKMWEWGGGEILPPSLFLCFPISCQCLPLSKLSFEPVLMEPGKCSQQGLASAKQGKAGEFGG